MKHPGRLLPLHPQCPRKKGHIYGVPWAHERMRTSQLRQRHIPARRCNGDITAVRCQSRSVPFHQRRCMHGLTALGTPLGTTLTFWAHPEIHWGLWPYHISKGLGTDSSQKAMQPILVGLTKEIIFTCNILILIEAPYHFESVSGRSDLEKIWNNLIHGFGRL